MSWIQAIPDPSPFLSRGTLGALVFVVVVFVLAGAFVTVKVFTLQSKKNGPGSNGQALQDAQKQLDALRAGSQPIEFWVRKYDESAEKAARPLMAKLELVIKEQARMKRNQQIMLNAMRRAKIITDEDEN